MRRIGPVMEDPTKIFVKPVPGCFVRDPLTKEVLPEQGAWVPRVDAVGRWWRKRLRNGVVVLAEPPRKEPEVPDFEERDPEPSFDGKRKRR